MTYQVLARKWRPQSFADFVGQQHVVRALTNALEQGRVHHAWLFTGTRGVGKTTLARILARCLNCETGVTATPCGTCDNCRAIEQGRFMDLVEVDAASRTGVDETRDLIDNVPYAPVRGRYKVYLIDEVHMFSKSSFNALLKTLEEPPPHVKFLFATTDWQKIPVTILSRCLQFHLKRLTLGEIAGQLERVLKAEGIAGEPAALARLAVAAEGSMRDALSLLDQAIAFGRGAVNEVDVREMLGDLDRDFAWSLAESLADGDPSAMLVAVDRIAAHGPDFGAILQALAALIHRLAIARIDPAAAAEGLETPERLATLAARFAPEDLQLDYQIALHGIRDLPLAPDARGLFEMSLLRMLLFRPEGQSQGTTRGNEASPVAKPAQAPVPVTAPAPAAIRTAATAPAGDDWAAIVAELGLGGMTRELALNCTLVRRDGPCFVLELDPKHRQLKSERVLAGLREAIARRFGNEARVSVEVGEGARETPARAQARAVEERHAAARAAIESDPGVRGLMERFDARVIPESVEPR